jgi:spore coat protein U-like protein
MACDVLGGRPARRRPILGVKVMKKILILAAMASVSTSAFAGNTTTSNGASVTFDGNRAQVCEVRNYENTVTFGALDNFGAGGSTTDSLDIFCNTKFAASIKSTNGLLQLTSGDPGTVPVGNTTAANGYPGFASGVDYEVAFTVGSFSGTADTTLIGRNTAIPLGVQNPINVSGSVTYTTIAGGSPLLAGNYADTLTLTMTPQAF